LAVIPVDEIARIALDYVLNDKEVQELAIHVQSREFQELVEKVLNLEELEDVSIIVCMSFKVLNLIQSIFCSVLTGNCIAVF
jgi:hypothetical protein